MTESKRRGRLDSAGDIAQVYAQYKPELKGYITRRVDSPDEADDILQDVFYKLSKIDFDKNPIEFVSAWLYRAASNRIIDRRRKKKELSMPETREKDEDDYFLSSLSGYFADEGDDPEAMFRNELLKAEIADALSELPPEQKAVFELTEYDGISYKEISESTGVPVSTLLSRKHYAVAYLRKRLYQVYLDVTEGQ